MAGKKSKEEYTLDRCVDSLNKEMFSRSACELKVDPKCFGNKVDIVDKCTGDSVGYFYGASPKHVTDTLTRQAKSGELAKTRAMANKQIKMNKLYGYSGYKDSKTAGTSKTKSRKTK